MGYCPWANVMWFINGQIRLLTWCGSLQSPFPFRKPPSTPSMGIQIFSLEKGKIRETGNRFY